MSTIIMPGIRHLNKSSKKAAKPNNLGENKGLSPSLVYQGEKGELWTVEGQITDPYIFTLVALPLIEERLKFSRQANTEGLEVRLEEWVRSVA